MRGKALVMRPAGVPVNAEPSFAADIKPLFGPEAIAL